MFKNKMFLKKLSFNSALLIIGILITSKAILAWSSPASVPPDGNVATPLNTGINGQIKTGTLEINGGFLLGDTSAGITGAFSVNNLDFLVTPTGNVGIGATSTAKLNVAGDINYTGNLLQNGVPLSFGGQWDTSGNNIYNTNTGNVGIGTTTPSSKLDVVGGVRSQYLSLRKNSAIYGFIGTDGDWKGLTGTNLALSADGSNGITFFTNGNVTERMRIDTSGNVGIGTTNPNSKLQVIGQITGGFGAVETGGTLNWNDVSNARSGSGYSLLLGDAANGPGPANYFHPFSFEYSSKNGGGNMTQLAIPYLNAYGNSSDSLWLRSRYGGTWYPWRQILTENYNGRVGIGISNPSYKLVVQDSSANTWIQSYNPSSARAAGFYAQADGDQWAEIFSLGSAYGGGYMGVNNGSYVLFGRAAGVGTYYNYPLVLGTNNNERMRIGTDGNVGIGTASPSYKLQVDGDVYVNGGWLRVSGGAGLFQQSHGLYIWPVDDNSNYWGSRSDYGWRYQDRSGNNRGYTYFDGSGFGFLSSDGSWRVRTNPGYQELFGTTYGADAQFNSYYVRGNTAYGFIGSSVYADTINTGIAGDPLELNYQRSGDIRFTGGDLTMAYGRYIYPGSNSGLGDYQKSYYITSNSGYGLYTNTSMYFGGGIYPQGYGFQGAQSYYGTLSLITPKNGYYGLLFGQSSANPNLMFDGSGNGGIYYENAGYWSQYYLAGTRHLNINTSTDLNATLGIEGTGRFTGNVGIGISPVTNVKLYIADGPGDYGLYVNGNSSQTGSVAIKAVNFASSGNGVEGMVIGDFAEGVYGSASGNSGTGVYGNFYSIGGKTGVGVSGVASGAYSYGVYCLSGDNPNGCGGNRAWYNSSDERLKENIYTISDSLKKVMGLRGVEFNWKNDSKKQKQIGFIAQETLPLVPEVVGKDPSGYYAMSYGSVAPLLVEAIKDQQKQIEEQKNKNLELQKQLDELKSRIDKLR